MQIVNETYVIDPESGLPVLAHSETIEAVPDEGPPPDPIQALKAAVAERVSDPAVNSIAKLKAAIVAAFDD